MRYNFKTRILESIGTSIWELPLDTNIAEPVLLMRCCKDVKMKVIQALNEAFIRAQSLGKVKLTVNPFFDLHKKVGDNTNDYLRLSIAQRGIQSFLVGCFNCFFCTPPPFFCQTSQRGVSFFALFSKPYIKS